MDTTPCRNLGSSPGRNSSLRRYTDSLAENRPLRVPTECSPFTGTHWSFRSFARTAIVHCPAVIPSGAAPWTGSTTVHGTGSRKRIRCSGPAFSGQVINARFPPARTQKSLPGLVPSGTLTSKSCVVVCFFGGVSGARVQPPRMGSTIRTGCPGRPPDGQVTRNCWPCITTGNRSLGFIPVGTVTKNAAGLELAILRTCFSFSGILIPPQASQLQKLAPFS
mmetsp:Transcript_92753/g.139155  ORF Transcript_92753/g.139155 Transcript_92753/m.139155 type:complete len:221 (+) Transcript_92753:214-876(+)